ncbi:unnamed protein product [Rangifer tarandus platyrhynchus]|uniref:Uncharacterized protein n=1 Tax=Rangifer tarandus platyrhynchus TaxID=3082113 RepID=A0AC60A9H1_RANTA
MGRSECPQWRAPGCPQRALVTSLSSQGPLVPLSSPLAQVWCPLGPQEAGRWGLALCPWGVDSRGRVARLRGGCGRSHTGPLLRCGFSLPGPSSLGLGGPTGSCHPAYHCPLLRGAQVCRGSPVTDREGDGAEMLPKDRRRTALLKPGVSEASGACPPPPLAGSRREEGRSTSVKGGKAQGLQGRPHAGAPFPSQRPVQAP